MKVLLEIKDSEADYIMALLNNIKNIKVKAITKEKAQLIEDIKQAVDELNAIKSGKKKGRPAIDLINEL